MIGLLLAELERASYIVRPFDMLADRRRWFWQRPTRCCVYVVRSVDTGRGKSSRHVS